MTHSPGGASAGGLHLDELEKVARVPTAATLAAEAAERLARFAKGEAMQHVWSGPYPPDGIRADLRLVLAPAATATEAQG